MQAVKSITFIDNSNSFADINFAEIIIVSHLFLIGLLLCTLLCIVQTQESSTSPTEADKTDGVSTSSPIETDGSNTSMNTTNNTTEADGRIDNSTSPAKTDGCPDGSNSSMNNATEADGGIIN